MAATEKLVLLHSNDMHGDFLAEKKGTMQEGGVFLLSGFICLIEAFVTVRYCMEGEMIRDGKLTDSVLAPAIMVLFGVVAVTLLIRQRQVRLEDSAE